MTGLGFLAILGGFAGSKVAGWTANWVKDKAVGALQKSPLEQLEQLFCDATTKWWSGLPEYLRNDRFDPLELWKAEFAINTSAEAEKRLAEKLLEPAIPTEDDFLDMLRCRVRNIRLSAVADDRVPHALIGSAPEDVEPHLRKLARQLQNVCRQFPPLRDVALLSGMKRVLEKLEAKPRSGQRAGLSGQPELPSLAPFVAQPSLSDEELSTQFSELLCCDEGLASELKQKLLIRFGALQDKLRNDERLAPELKAKLLVRYGVHRDDGMFDAPNDIRGVRHESDVECAAQMLVRLGSGTVAAFCIVPVLSFCRPGSEHSKDLIKSRCTLIKGLALLWLSERYSSPARVQLQRRTAGGTDAVDDAIVAAYGRGWAEPAVASLATRKVAFQEDQAKKGRLIGKYDLALPVDAAEMTSAQEVADHFARAYGKGVSQNYIGTPNVVRKLNQDLAHERDPLNNRGVPYYTTFRQTSDGELEGVSSRVVDALKQEIGSLRFVYLPPNDTCEWTDWEDKLERSLTEILQPTD